METTVPSHHQLKRCVDRCLVVNPFDIKCFFSPPATFSFCVFKQEIKVSEAAAAAAASEACNLILQEWTDWANLGQHFLKEWQEASLKHMGNVALGEPWATREVQLVGTDASHCNGDAALLMFPSQSQTLTGTWFGSAALGFSSTSLAVSAPQLWHGSVAVSYSGDLPFATGHWARRPRRPQAPPSVLANWASKFKHITQRSNTHVLYYALDSHYSAYRRV